MAENSLKMESKEQKIARLMQTLKYAFNRDPKARMSEEEYLILERDVNDIMGMLDSEKKYFKSKFGRYPTLSSRGNNEVANVVKNLRNSQSKQED